MKDAPWMTHALRELGVKEVPGAGDNPRIVAYHQSTTLKATDDEVPWCSSFVNWCLQQSGYRSTRSAAARSWSDYGVAAPIFTYGAVLVLSRGSNPALGHVGFAVDRDESLIWVLGGNQGDAVTIAPFAASRLVACRWAVPGLDG